MTERGPIETERWRVIIPRRDASEILVSAAEAETTLLLPEVRVPRWERLARNLNAELRRNWQLDAISLFPVVAVPPGNGDDCVQYHVAELIRPNDVLPYGLSWALVSSLTKQGFRETGDLASVLQFLDEPRDHTGKDAPFGHLGWFKEVTSWLEKAISPFGLHWDGRFHQLHASRSFCLIRFETRPYPVWLKAVGEPNTREFAITCALDAFCPGYAPRLMATRPDWNAWLSEETASQTLHEANDQESWHRVVRTLACLQIKSLSKTEQLLQAGAHTLRFSFLKSIVDDFFQAAGDVEVKNVEPAVAGSSPLDLTVLQIQVRDVLAYAEALKLPDALGHLDASPGNIVVSKEHCFYLDWAEACIGFPFLTFQFLLQHFRRAFDETLRDEDALIRAYLAPWADFLSHDAIQDAMAVAPALAVFAYAIRCVPWSDPQSLHDPRTVTYRRALLRRLARELDRSEKSNAAV